MNGIPKATGQTEASPQLRTLERGLQIIGLFDVEHPEWTFVDVCKHAKLSKATAFRFLKKLEAMKFLAYDEEKRTYHLGSSLLRAAYVASTHAQIVRTAHPLLARLAAETGEATNLAVKTDQGPLIVDAVFAANAFQPHLMVGVILKGLATAHARAMAAFASENERLRMLLEEQQQRTDATITDPRALAEILRQVREEGLAFSQEEWFRGACAAAAPVTDANGDVSLTIAVVAPKERFDPEDRHRYGQALLSTAEELSRQLGAAPNSVRLA